MLTFQDLLEHALRRQPLFLGQREALLEEGRDRADAVKGAFEVRGDLPDAEGAFELVAGAWLDQPEGWITVGLRGRGGARCTAP